MENGRIWKKKVISCEMIWKIWKKSKLKSEKIRKNTEEKSVE